MSRITNNMIISNFMSNFRKSSNNLNKYMNQLSTGEKFSQVSDDPINSVKAMKLDSTIKFNQRYSDNAKEGINWLSVTDSALDDVVKTLRSLRDSAVKAANETLTPDDRKVIKNEVDQLKEHLVEVANSKYGNSYIFNGVKTKLQPYKNASTTNLTDYEANGAVLPGKLAREVGAGTTININVTGNEIGFGQMFIDIQNFSNALDTDDSDAIETGLDNIDSNIESVLSARAQVGSRQNRLDLTVDRLSSQKIEYTDILSKTEDTDIAETIMKYKNEENVYRTALSTGASIIQPSLIDFLK